MATEKKNFTSVSLSNVFIERIKKLQIAINFNRGENNSYSEIFDEMLKSYIKENNDIRETLLQMAERNSSVAELFPELKEETTTAKESKEPTEVAE